MRKKVFAYAVVSLLITVGTISVFSEESQSAIANEADLSVIEPWCTSKPIQRAHDESFETRVYNDGPDDVSETIEVKWYLDGNPVDTSYIGSLDAGDHRDVSGNIPWPDDYDNHQVCAKVIVPSGYYDPDTSNNEKCTTAHAVNYGNS
jgi:hypothetical protein